MDDETRNLEIAFTDQMAFVLCLVLGTLEAMRRGDWPLEAGIWTLGRPVFWKPLKDSIPAEILDILQAADELTGLAELRGGPAANEELDRMISAVRSRLSLLPEKSWYARWTGACLASENDEPDDLEYP